MSATREDPEALAGTVAAATPIDGAAAVRLEQAPLLIGKKTYSTNDSDDGQREDGERQSILHDARDTIALGVPIFLAMLSWIGMKTTDSALLGHVSADALAAAALSDIWVRFVRRSCVAPGRETIAVRDESWDGPIDH